MNKTGVTDITIKKSAELCGDSPGNHLIMLHCSSCPLTTLRSIIAGYLIVLPILISVMLPAASAAWPSLMPFHHWLRTLLPNWTTFSQSSSTCILPGSGLRFVFAVATGIATLIMTAVESAVMALSLPSAQLLSRATPSSSPVLLVVLQCLLHSPYLCLSCFEGSCYPSISYCWYSCGALSSLPPRALRSKAMNLLLRLANDGVTDAGPVIILMVGIGGTLQLPTQRLRRFLTHSSCLASCHRTLLHTSSSFCGPLAIGSVSWTYEHVWSCPGIAALIIGLNTLESSAVPVKYPWLQSEPRQVAPKSTLQNVDWQTSARLTFHHRYRKMLPTSK